MDAYFIISLIIIAANLLMVWLFFYRKGIFTEFIVFSNNKLSPWQNYLLWIGSTLLFLSLWNILAEIEPSGINKIPSPIQTIVAAVKLVTSGKLIQEAAISCLRVLIGFGFASIIGVSVGLLSGSFLLVNKLIVPINSFLRYIPPTAFISLLIIYFGIGEQYKYAVIFFGVIFFIIQMVIDVIEDLDKRYLEMSVSSGFSNLKMFWKVVIPFSLPRVIDVLRINLSASWTFLVAAELIGAEKGLGHLIAVSQRYLRIDDLYVGILAFGIIGIITDRLIDLISKKLFRWHYIKVR